MVGWHHQLNGHGFKQSLGVGEGQESLACSPIVQSPKSQTRLSDWTEYICVEPLKARLLRKPPAPSGWSGSTVWILLPAAWGTCVLGSLYGPCLACPPQQEASVTSGCPMLLWLVELLLWLNQRLYAGGADITFTVESFLPSYRLVVDRTQ